MVTHIHIHVKGSDVDIGMMKDLYGVYMESVHSTYGVRDNWYERSGIVDG